MTYVYVYIYNYIYLRWHTSNSDIEIRLHEWWIFLCCRLDCRRVDPDTKDNASSEFSGEMR